MRSSRVFRPAVAAAGAIVFVSALVLVALNVVGTQASHRGGMEAMSIDLDVTGNTATSLGPREECLVISPGDTVTLDVTAEGIPPTSPMIAFQFSMYYPAGVVSVTYSDPNYLLGSTPGSEVFNPEGPTPDNDGEWIGMAADVNTEAAETGSGVLARLTVKVGAAAQAGVYELALAYAAHVDSLVVPWPPDLYQGAFLAVATNCDNLPTPSPSPTPTTPPAGLTLGIDHNGPPPDINEGPVEVPPGSTFSIQVVGVLSADTGRFATASLRFDQSVLQVVGCVLQDDRACSSSEPYAVDVDRWMTETGQPMVIGNVSFAVVGADGECSVLWLESYWASDDGEVCIDAHAPAPTPTVSPSPTPIPPPPTNTPTLGPPRASSPASVTPSPGGAGQALPVALPATGGRTGDASPRALSVMAAGVAAAVAVGAGALLRSRKHG